MGILESTLRDQSSAVGGVRAGTVIPATAFQDGRPFKVKILSSSVSARGGSASIRTGEIKQAGKKPLVVALKVFQFTLDERQGKLYYDMYLKELEAAKRLWAAEQYILPFLGLAVLGHQPVIVSQFMRNGNFLDYVESRRPFKVNRQRLMTEVAGALAFLHNNVGLVHGDLKCENILISNDGRALLADFGLSHMIETAEGGNTTASLLRETNTLRFAAPELLTGDEISGRVPPRTPQTDVWAFGMVLVQAFTGKRPWPDTHTAGVFLEILVSGTHPRPGEDATANGFTDEWWEICLRCWDSRPGKRPTMETIFDDLSGKMNREGQLRREHLVASGQTPSIASPSPGNDACGGKKALLIGIVYKPRRGVQHPKRVQLSSPHEDINAMKTMLQNHSFTCRLMLDKPDHPESLKPRRHNITRELISLVKDAKPGDKLVLCFSGHVEKIPTTGMKKKDGLEKYLVPLDSELWGYIQDSLLNNILVSKLPAGVKLLVIVDGSYSGTILGLRYNWYMREGNIRGPVAFPPLSPTEVVKGRVGVRVQQAPGSQILCLSAASDASLAFEFKKGDEMMSYMGFLVKAYNGNNNITIHDAFHYVENEVRARLKAARYVEDRTSQISSNDPCLNLNKQLADYL